MIALLWLGRPSSTCAKLHIVTASNNWDHPMRSLYYCLFTPHIYGLYSACTSVHGESHIQHNVNREVATTSPFHNEPHQSHVLLVKAASDMISTSWAQHHRKPWAASAQSFTLWQQAIIEITRRYHSAIACSCHIYKYMGVILRAHPFRGESHIQRNVNREVATVYLDKCMIFVAWPNTEPKI